MSEKVDLEWQSQLHEEDLFKIIGNSERMVGLERLDPETEIRLLSVGSSLRNVENEETIDHLGNKLLPRAIDGDVLYAFWPDYWQKLKNEFRIFICTKDKKYADLRKKLSRSAAKSNTAIVSTIAAAMATQFGVVAGVLIPFIALCLVVLARTGKEAFCITLDWNTPLKTKAESENKNG